MAYIFYERLASIIDVFLHFYMWYLYIHLRLVYIYHVTKTAQFVGYSYIYTFILTSLLNHCEPSVFSGDNFFHL